LRVTAIEPGVVSNDTPTRLTLIGEGFIPGAYTVSIGGQAITDVRTESLTTLSGTLPVGLCPGTYAATVIDTLGQQTSGGSVQAQGTLSATSLNPDIAAPALSVMSQVQHVRVALPRVQIRDTTCGTGAWRLRVSISDFAYVGPRPSRLVPLSIQAEDTPSSRQPVTLVDGAGTTTLLLPRPADWTSVNLGLSAEIEIPAYPAAGAYRATVAVALVAAPP
jgi:hypothetical protein